jgi:TrwC relaxase
MVSAPTPTLTTGVSAARGADSVVLVLRRLMSGRIGLSKTIEKKRLSRLLCLQARVAWPSREAISLMTVHVLHAGDGYTYLTRQVASGDHQRRRGEALAEYYTSAGNPPGRWLGTGLAAMGVDGAVSEAQMRALFGEGLHPDAHARIQEALSRGVDREAAVAAVRLGRRFPSIDQSHEVWRDRLNAGYAEFENAHGHRPERGPERDLVRWNVCGRTSRPRSWMRSSWRRARWR